MQRCDLESEYENSEKINNKVYNQSASANSHIQYMKNKKDNKDGYQSTIENKVASLSDDLNQVFGEFHQNADDDHSSQYYNLNAQFHEDSNQFYPISNNRKSIVSQSYQTKSQNQSCISQQRSLFKDILKDISPRNHDQELQNQIFTDDGHVYNQQSRSISNDIISQSALENIRKSQEDRFSNQIKIFKNQNDKNNSSMSYKENSIQIFNDDKLKSRQRQSINDFNFKEKNIQLSTNQSQNQSEMDSRYKELLRYAQLNKLLNNNSQNIKLAEDSRQILSHQRSMESTAELCDLDGRNILEINNQYQFAQQKNQHPPFSEQHGKSKKLNNLNSEYGTVHHDNECQYLQYQQDQADSCTQNTLSAKFNDVCIKLQNRDESIINPIYFVQNNESLSQNTDVAHYDNQNQINFGNYDQIELKYLQNHMSSKNNLQYQDEIEMNQNSIEVRNNIEQMNKGTDPKTISSSSQLSIAKQQRNLNYQQLIKSQYEDFNQEEESHFFSITDIQYQEAVQPSNQISKDKSLNERSRHQMLDVQYFSLNQNSEKTHNFDGQNNRNNNNFNPYTQQNTSSHVNQTLNHGFLNQTSSTEQEYYRQKISQQLNMNLKSEFGKKLMDGQRKKQISPFQDPYIINEKNIKNEYKQQQPFAKQQTKSKDSYNIFKKKQSENTVISHRTKSSHENRTENIFSSQNTQNMVTYREKPSESNIHKQGSDVTSPNYMVNSNINTQRIEQNDNEKSSSVENQSHQIYQMYLKTRNNNKQNSYQFQINKYAGDQKRKQERQSNSINVKSRVTNADASDNMYFNTSNSPSQLANAAFNNRKDIDIRSYNQMSEIYEDTQKDDSFIKLQRISNHHDEHCSNIQELQPALTRKELILKLFKKNQGQNQSQQMNQQQNTNEQETNNAKPNSLLSQQIQYLNQKYRVSHHKFSNLIPKNEKKDSIQVYKNETNNYRSSSADQQASRNFNVHKQPFDFEYEQKIFQKKESRNSQHRVNELETGQFNNIGDTFKIDDSQVIEGLGKGIQNHHSSIDSKGTQRSSKINRLKQFENERKQSLNNTSNIERLRIVELNKMYLNENKAKFDLTLFQNSNKYKLQSLQDSNYQNNIVQSQTLDSHQNSNFTLGDRNLINQQKEKYLSPYSSLEYDHQKFIDPYQSQYNKIYEKPEQKIVENQLYVSKYQYNLELDQKIQYEKYLQSQHIVHPKQQILMKKNYQGEQLIQGKFHKRSLSQIKTNDYILSDRINLDQQQFKIEIIESNNLNSSRRASNNSLERPISNFYKNYIINKSTKNNKNNSQERYDQQKKSVSQTDKQEKIMNLYPSEISRIKNFENTIRSVTSNANYKNNQIQSSSYTNCSQIRSKEFTVNNPKLESELQKCKSEQDLKKQQYHLQPRNKQWNDSNAIDRYHILKERQQQLEIQSKQLVCQNNYVQNDNFSQANKQQSEMISTDIKYLNQNKESDEQEYKRKVSTISNMKLKSSFGQNQITNYQEDTPFLNLQIQTQGINLSQIDQYKRFELNPSLINFKGNHIISPKYEERLISNHNLNEKEQTLEDLKILTQSYDQKNELLRKKYLDFNIFANKTQSEIQTLEDKNEKKFLKIQHENEEINYQATLRSQSNNSIFLQTQNLQQHTENPYSYFQSQHSYTNIQIQDQQQRQDISKNNQPNVFNFLSLLFGQNYFFKVLQKNIQNKNSEDEKENQKLMEYSHQIESQDTYFDQRCMTPKLSEYLKQEEENEKQKLELYDQLYNHCQISQTTGKCSHSQSFNSSMKNQKEYINILNQNHNSSSLHQSSLVDNDHYILKPKQNFLNLESQQLSQNIHTELTQQNSSNQYLQVPCINRRSHENLNNEEKVDLDQIWNQINPNSSSKKLRDLMGLQYEQAQMLIDLQTQFMQVQQIEDSFKQKIENLSSKQNDLGSIDSYHNTHRPISTLNKSKKTQKSIQNQVMLSNSKNDNSNFDMIDEVTKFQGSNVQSQEQINQTISIKSKSIFENKSRKQNTAIQSKQNSISSHNIISQQSNVLSKKQLSQISSQKQSTYELIKKIYKQMEKIDQKIQLKEKIDQDQMNKMWRVIRKFKQMFKKLKQQNGVLCVQNVNKSSVSSSDAFSIQQDFQNQENNFNATNLSSKSVSHKKLSNSQSFPSENQMDSEQQTEYDEQDMHQKQSSNKEQLSERNDIDAFRVAQIKKMISEQDYIANETQQISLKSQREKQLSSQNEQSLAQSQQIELTSRQYLSNDFNHQFPSKKDQQSQPVSIQSSYIESSLKHNLSGNNPILQIENAINMDQTALSQIIINQSSCCTNIQKNQYFQQMSLEQLQNLQMLNLPSQKNTEAQDFEMKIESKQYGQENNFLTQQQQHVREIDFEIKKNINQSSGTASLNSKDSMYFQKQPFIELIENNESQILLNIQTSTNQIKKQQIQSTSETLNISQLASKRIKKDNLNKSEPQFEEQIKKACSQMVFECNDQSSKELNTKEDIMNENQKFQEMILANSNSNSTQQIGQLKDQSQTIKSSLSLVDTEKYIETVKQLNKAVLQKQKLVEKLQRIKDKIKKAKNIKNIYKLQSQRSLIEQSLNQESLNFIEDNEKYIIQDQKQDSIKIENQQQEEAIVSNDEQTKVDQFEQNQNINELKNNNSFIDHSINQFEQICYIRNEEQQNRSKSLNQYDQEYQNPQFFLNQNAQQFKIEKKLNFDIYQNDFKNIFFKKKAVEEKQNLSNDYSLYTYSQQKIMQNSKRGIFQKIVDLQKLRNQRENSNHIKSSLSPNNIITPSVVNLNNYQNALLQNNNSFQSSLNNTVALQDYANMNTNQKNMHTGIQNEKSHLQTQKINNSLEKSLSNIGSGLRGQIQENQMQFQRQVEFTPSQASNLKDYSEKNQIASMQLSSKFAKKMFDQKNASHDIFIPKKLDYFNNEDEQNQKHAFIENQNILVIDQKEMNMQNNSQDIEEYSKQASQYYKHQLRHTQSSQEFARIPNQSYSFKQSRQTDQLNQKMSQNEKQDVRYQQQEIKPMIMKQQNMNVKVLDSQPYTSPAYRREQMLIREYERNQSQYDQFVKSDKVMGRQSNKSQRRQKSDIQSYTKTIPDDQSSKYFIKNSKITSHLQTRSFDQ